MRVLAATAVTLAPVLAVSGTADAAPTPVHVDGPTQQVWGWAALAYSPTTGTVAYADDYPSLDAAAQAARARCGARDCQAVVEVADGCASMAEASNGALGWAWAGSLAAANDTAVRYARGRHARVIAYACTTGHQ